MTNLDHEATLAFARGVAAFATREWQTMSFAKLARALYATGHERDAFVRGYLTAATHPHKYGNPHKESAA